MDCVEAEGNSIDEAIERALKELGADRERVEIQIVSDASRGLFGLGGRKARVRATLRSPLNLTEDTVSSAFSEPSKAERDQPATTMVGEDRPPDVDVPSKPERRSTRPERRSTAKDVDTPPVDDKTLEHGKAVLEEVVRQMGFAVSVEASADNGEAWLALRGDTSGILIGRRGQTLDAIEYLVNRIVARSEDHAARIVVDSEDYRIRRRQSLEEMADRMAEQVRRRGKAVTLNPMPPRDRRIVHLALQDDPTLTTRSAGSGHLRRLLIAPAGSSSRRRS